MSSETESGDKSLFLTANVIVGTGFINELGNIG